MNVVALFQEVKRICGICPCCGEVFRLSDAVLYTQGRPPQTPFDRLQAQRERFEREVEKFEDSKRAVREAASRRGRLDAERRLREIATCFADHEVDPHDVKVLFDPVRYVVFDGLCQERPRRVVLLDHQEGARAAIQDSIAEALRAGNLEWITLRIDDEGRVRVGR